MNFPDQVQQFVEDENFSAARVTPRMTLAIALMVAAAEAFRVPDPVGSSQ